MLDKFLNGTNPAMRLARTVFEGVLSILAVNAADFVGLLNLSPETATILTAAIMAVITPLMAMVKTGDDE